MLQRPLPAQEGQACAALVRRRIGQEQEPDLAGAAAVRRAAGAAVRALDRHDADRRGQPLGLLAKRQAGDRVLTLVADGGDGQIPRGQLVCKVLHLPHLLGRQRLVQIDRAADGVQMKADVRRAKQRIRRIGEQVLAGVLLHEVEAARPVDFGLHGGAHGQRGVRMVQEHAVRLVAAGDRHGDPLRAQQPGIAGLAAGIGKEHGAVENDIEAIRCLRAGEHLRVAAFPVAVGKIQAIGHMETSDFAYYRYIIA